MISYFFSSEYSIWCLCSPFNVLLLYQIDTEVSTLGDLVLKVLKGKVTFEMC